MEVSINLPWKKKTPVACLEFLVKINIRRRVSCKAALNSICRVEGGLTADIETDGADRNEGTED